jgi:hypothetical protein
MMIERMSEHVGILEAVRIHEFLRQQHERVVVSAQTEIRQRVVRTHIVQCVRG